jgi:hypothetical protein
VSRKTSESANVAADVDTGHMVELLLSYIDDEPQAFSHQQDILFQPGIWIGDTAATVHMSPHQEGMVNKKHTVKMSNHETCSNPGERIFTDIASIRESDGIKVSKPHWCIKVDERTQLKFSSFHENKDGMVNSLGYRLVSICKTSHNFPRPCHLCFHETN